MSTEANGSSSVGFSVERIVALLCLKRHFNYLTRPSLNTFTKMPNMNSGVCFSNFQEIMEKQVIYPCME